MCEAIWLLATVTYCVTHSYSTTRYTHSTVRVCVVSFSVYFPYKNATDNRWIIKKNCEGDLRIHYCASTATVMSRWEKKSVNETLLTYSTIHITYTACCLTRIEYALPLSHEHTLHCSCFRSLSSTQPAVDLGAMYLAGASGETEWLCLLHTFSFTCNKCVLCEQTHSVWNRVCTKLQKNILFNEWENILCSSYSMHVSHSWA